MVVRSSKFRHVFGQVAQEKFEEIRPHTISSESTLVKSNGNFVSLAWASGGGGILAVLPISQTGRIRPEQPMIRSEGGSILDFEFNPFHDLQLYTAGEDCKIKLWEIPEAGLTESLTIPRVELHGHGKKIGLINTHPTASYVVASASFDHTVRIWDVESAYDVFQVRTKDIANHLQWNTLGNLIGITSRNKLTTIYDPRQQSEVLEKICHEGGKPQKLCWLNDTVFVTCGFNKASYRQMAIWDLRSPDSPLRQMDIDNSAGVIFPFYDEDTSILFLAGKGDGNIRYYELAEDLEPHRIDIFGTNVPCKGISFIPKRKVDIQKCEIMRAVKLTNNTIDLISFQVPRRGEAFADDIYPPCVNGIPAVSANEWAQGKDLPPLRSPITEISQSTSAVQLELKSPQPMGDLLSQINELQRQLQEKDDENQDLRQQLAEKDQLIDQLKRDLEESKSE